jgi:hypothetical protein
VIFVGLIVMQLTSTRLVAADRVFPLYKHLFPPAYAPTLSFVGLPWKIVPFPLYELQSRWVARLLSDRVQLPSVNDMMARIL